MESHNYKTLKEEVWDTGLCSGCSICATVCPMKTIYFVNNMPTSCNLCKSEKNGVPCGACYSSCPRIETYRKKHGVGNIRSSYAVRSLLKIPKKQSGGAITAILYNALEKKLIDSVITVGQDHTTLQTYSIALSSPDALITHAGSKYIWYTPSLLALRDLIETGVAKRIAVIGTPCVIQGLRKMMESDNSVLNRFKEHVVLLIGVFCTEIFDYEEAKKLLNSQGIEPTDIEKIDIKKNLIVKLYNKDTIEIPIPSGLKKEGCSYCLDFTAVDADISAGSIGSEEGYTTILIRNRKGEYYLNSAIENGCIKTQPLESIKIIEKLASKKYEKNKKQG